MNSLFSILSWVRNHEIKMYFLYISLMFLPLNMNLNNIFLVVFMIIHLIEGGYRTKIAQVLKHLNKILPITLLFLIIALGFFYSEFKGNALKQIERSIPFLTIPIIFLSQPVLFSKRKNHIFYSLVLGCLFATLICWINLAVTLINNDEVYRLFTWEYSRLNLIKPLDQHTAYLSLFVLTSVGFLVSMLRVKKDKFRVTQIIVTVVLITFLMHMLSRTAIAYFIICTILYFIVKKKYVFLFGFIASIGLFVSVLLNNSADKSDFFKRLLVEQVGIEGDERADGRFKRWKYSWQLFKENPIFGTGTGDADILRTIKYRENADIYAYKQRYNAHNQFFEFLSAQGVFGALLFLYCFGYLLNLTYKHKDYLFLYIISGVVVCCITESMFRRSWGFVFFAIMGSLLIVSTVNINMLNRNK